MLSAWLAILALQLEANPTTPPTTAPAAVVERRVESFDIAKVNSSYPVNFCLNTHGDEQFVAYYDINRDMTIAKRKLTDNTWQIVKLPDDQPSPFGNSATSTRTKWDSHNTIIFTFDDDGQIHLTGNMHCNPLLYFRTEKPGDITTFKRLDKMTGQKESKVTYPRFFRGPNKELIFAYRDGRSGDGADYYNVYDCKTQTWKPLLDTPLTDGRTAIEGVTAYAYAQGPVLGPDGMFHLVWVWRDTPACETNHSLCYARSKDLIHWEDSNGKPYQLPITPQTSEVVDPVPVNGGMINSNIRIAFDAQKRVILTNHKFDKDGNTQIYNFRREATGWKSAQATNWNFRWEFTGGGSMITQVSVHPVAIAPDGMLCQTWSNKQDGPGGTYLDPETLLPTEPYRAKSRYPAAVYKLEQNFPGLATKIMEDQGKSPDPKFKYILRWETLPANRDKPVEGPIPEPVMLKVMKIERTN